MAMRSARKNLKTSMHLSMMPDLGAGSDSAPIPTPIPSSDPTAGYLGHGLNRVRDQLDPGHGPSPNRAVTGERLATGLGGGSRCSICRTASELAQALQRQSGASLSALGMLPLLGGKMAFYRSLRTTVFSLSVVVQAWRTTHAGRLVQPQLAPGLEPPQTLEALHAFVQLYGDSLITEAELGAECVGVFTFRSESREQAERVEQALRAGGLVHGFQLGGDLHRSLEQASRSSATTIDFHYAVWGCSTTPSLRPDTLVAYALGFGQEAIDRPILLNLASEGYETLPQLGSLFQPVAANRELFTGRNGLLRQRQRLEEIINQCDSVADTLSCYGLAPDPELAPQRQRAREAIDAIASLGDRYRQAPALPLQAPDPASLALNSPRLQVRLNDGERMGGGGGEPFGYPDRGNAVARRRRLVRVGLRAGSRIDQIRLRYHQEPAGAADEWIEEVHGGLGGRDSGSIDLGPGVCLERIEARSGVPDGRVDQLWLTSSDGQRLGGGAGRGSNRSLDWQPGANQVLLGFQGRSKAELDALQAVIATFEPLAWEPVRPEEDD